MSAETARSVAAVRDGRAADRAAPDAATEFHFVLRCPCGETLTGGTEDQIVSVSFEHLRERHPEMADDYEREHVLAMARRLVKPADDRSMR